VQSINGALYDSQRFAIDWMRLDEQGRLVHGEESDVHNYNDYGADVLAVADAKVITVLNNLDDQIPGRLPEPSLLPSRPWTATMSCSISAGDVSPSMRICRKIPSRCVPAIK
jgi:hypothetical protein